MPLSFAGTELCLRYSTLEVVIMLTMCYITLEFCHCLIRLIVENSDIISQCHQSVALTTDCIVWHALIATSKCMVDILMVEYGIFNFATDAVYLGAIWSKFALELLL